MRQGRGRTSLDRTSLYKYGRLTSIVPMAAARKRKPAKLLLKSSSSSADFRALRRVATVRPALPSKFRASNRQWPGEKRSSDPLPEVAGSFYLLDTRGRA